MTVNTVTAGTITGSTVLCESNDHQIHLTESAAPSGNGTLSYQWYFSTTGTNWVDFSSISGVTEKEYHPTNDAVDTWYYRMDSYLLNGTTCTANSNIQYVQINNLTAGTISGTATICETGTAPLTGDIPLLHDGTLTYQWHYQTTSMQAFADITGATDQNYTTSALSEDTRFMREVTSTVSGVSCTKQSNEILVTVNNLAAGVISGATTVCETGTTPLSGDIPDHDGTSITYQWQSSSSENGSYGNVTGGTNQNYTTDALSADTWFKRIATSTTDLPQSCSKESNKILVAVNNLTAGSISISGPAIICEHETANLDGTLPLFDGQLTYQWQSHTSATSYANISGATDQTYTTIALTEDTWYQRIATSVFNTKSCFKTSTEVEVIVNNVTPGSISGETTVCETGTAVLSEVTPATGDYTMDYVWEYSTDGGANYNQISGATNTTYTTFALSQDTRFRRAVESVSPSPHVPCPAYSNVLLITVNNITPGTIAGATTICENETAPLTESAPATHDYPITYQWQFAPVGSAYSDIIGATDATYTTVQLTEDTWFKRSATSTSPLQSCTKISDPILVTVNNLTPGAITGATTICQNGTAPLTETTSPFTDGGSPSYQWQSSLTQNGSYSNISLATNATYTTAALTVSTWFQRIVYSTSGSSVCSKASDPVKVTVQGVVGAGSIGTTQTICNGYTPNALTSVSDGSGTGTISYVWEQDPGTGYALISGATLSTYAPGPLSVDTYYRRKTLSVQDAVSCYSGYTTPIVISVGAIVLPGSLTATPLTTCSGSAPSPITSATAGTGTGIISYKWENSTDGGSSWNLISGATLASYAPGALTTQTLFHRKTVATLNSVACESVTATNAVTVSINPLPTPSVSGPAEVCSSSTGNLYTISGASGHFYVWVVTGGVIASGQGTTSLTVTWGTGASGSVSITEVIMATGCSKTNTLSVTIDVAPIPVISGPVTVPVGSGGKTYTASISNSAPGASYFYAWNVSPPGTILSGQYSSSISVDWGATAGAGTVTVSAWNNATGCMGSSAPLAVTITPGGYTISGSFKYYNTAKTALNNLSLTLKTYPGGTTVSTTTTSSTGTYSFSNVSNGSYTISATTGKPEGGINMTDVAQVNSFISTPTSIEHVKWNSGDANNSGTINATDASLIQNHFLYPTNPSYAFTRGVWTFWLQPDASSANPPTSLNTIVVSGANITPQYYGMVVGDFNGSDIPPTSSKSSDGLPNISLIYDGSQVQGAGKEFDLPVYATGNIQIGAISLILNFPSDLLEITDVLLKDGKDGAGQAGKPGYNIDGNELRIGWTSAYPIDLKEHEAMVTIRVKTKLSFTLGRTIKFAVASNALNELADGSAMPINDAIISTDIVQSPASGIGQLVASDMTFENHPNPFTEFTTITYSLPVNGKVTIEIVNMVGQKMMTLVNEELQSGNYSYKLDSHTLRPGMYTATIRYSTKDEVVTKTIKLLHID